MKNKILVLAMICASNAYADNGVDIIYHQSWSNVPAPVDIEIHNTEWVTGSVTVTSTTVNQGQSALVAGFYNTILENTEQFTVTYNVDRYICIDNANCNHDLTSYTVKPQKELYVQNTLQFSEIMLNKGKYEDEAILKISGYEIYNCKAVGTVTVN